MRIEDLDGPRNKPDATEQAIDTLRWMGMNWHGDPLVQSDDLGPYREAMRHLAAKRLIYRCELTRSEIVAAATTPPPASELPLGREVHFPVHLRPNDPNMFAFDQRGDANYRVVVHDERFIIDDAVAGMCEQCPFKEIGDFVVWTRRDQPAYQLAVVVDDARQGVTDVVRGDDLLSSASRQEMLYRALELPVPRWWHVPLVIGPDGRKLAKRHGDTKIASYREAGVSPERIIGLLASWSGIINNPDSAPCEMTADDFCTDFSLDRLPRSPIIFTEEHHRWLFGS